MLVVITIIGILAGLVVTAALVARKKAKNAAIVIDLNQLEAALKAYKEKFGEYPPDFAGLQNTQSDPTTGQTYQVGVQRLILRHLARAFPRYTPAGGWNGFKTDVDTNWHINVDTLTPSTALMFWLGGQPDWIIRNSGTAILPTDGDFDSSKPVKGLLGFSANPTSPFDSSASRIRPFYDFDIASLGWLNTATTVGLVCWPRSQGVSDKSTGPIVYFRAENSNYTINGTALPANHDITDVDSSIVKYEGSRTPRAFVAPAVDTNLSNFQGMDNYNGSKAVVFTWVNPKTFQLFASGLDQKYATPYIKSSAVTGYVDITTFPTGESYLDHTTGLSAFKNLTNFSGGTLEDAIP
jgi:type II secretory pathway pseudopilin PulG